MKGVDILYTIEDTDGIKFKDRAMNLETITAVKLIEMLEQAEENAETMWEEVEDGVTTRQAFDIANVRVQEIETEIMRRGG